MLVHDWLTGMRGGEKVLESLCRLFPDADLLTLVHVPGRVSPRIERAARSARRSSSGCRAPARLYRHYLPLFPAAIELFDLDDADLVISTSHCAAKAVVPTGRARAPLLLPLADAVRLGSVRRVLRPGAGRPRGRAPLRGRVLAVAGAVGSRHGARVDRFVANSRLRCGPDRPVL